MTDVKIIQFQAMENNQTWQGCVLGLGADGILYVKGDAGWEVYMPLVFDTQN